MFFSHFVLAKKGPLARIWLAAHWDKKLTKAHILEINIESSVEGILQPKIKLALRTSGHLLLGVVRIYSRKAKYLLAECNEAFVKIKMAFRPGIVDLPEGNREAALSTITLPEVFHDFENMEMVMDMNATSLHQSRAEDITLKEDYGSTILLGEDTFGDIGFDDPDIARDATNIDEGFDQMGLCTDYNNSGQEEKTNNDNDQNDSAETVDNNSDVPVVNGDLENPPEIPTESIDVADGVYESGLFTDAPVAPVPLEGSSVDNSKEIVNGESVAAPPMELSDDDTYCCPPSIGPPSGPSSPDSVADQDQQENNLVINTTAAQPDPSVFSAPPPLPEAVTVVEEERTRKRPPPAKQNQPESFTLAPLDTCVIPRGVERVKNKRKRKLIVDEVKNISGEEMKSQLSDTRDIISTLDLAPPTKRLMHWKESGGVEKLFALPGKTMPSCTLSQLYLRHLTTRAVEDEVFETDERYPSLQDMPAHVNPPEEVVLPSKRPPPSEPEGDGPFKRLRSSEPEVPTVVQPVEEMVVVPPPPEQPQPQPEEVVEPQQVVVAPAVTDAVPTADVTNTLSEEQQQQIVIPESAEEVQAAVAGSKDVALPAENPEEGPAPPLVNGPVEEPVTKTNHTEETTAAETPKVSEAVPVEVTEAHSPNTKSNRSATDVLFDQLTGKLVNCPDQGEEQEPVEGQAEQQKIVENTILAMEDDDDYHNPASVGAALEEQLTDETYEQFEVRVHSKRAAQMLRIMKCNLEAGNIIPFSALTRGNKRKQVAQKFYTCLVLKKQQAIELKQSESYGEVYITCGPQLEAMLQ